MIVCYQARYNTRAAETCNINALHTVAVAMRDLTPPGATRRNMRRGERVTVQGPVKEQQPDGMSHGGGGGGKTKLLGSIVLGCGLLVFDDP